MKPDRPLPAPAYVTEGRALLRIGRIISELSPEGRLRVVQFVVAQFGAKTETPS